MMLSVNAHGMLHMSETLFGLAWVLIFVFDSILGQAP